MTALSRSSIDRWLAAVDVPPALPRPAPSHADTLENQGGNQNTPQVHTTPMAPTRHNQRGAYERRPRHKTKPHRYEYKSKSSTRRSSTNRRHTLNDNFHAPNVSKARLTRPAHITTGIFPKGKTSSPVKCRRTFSETDFLHKKLQHTADARQEQHVVEGSRPPTARPPSVGTFLYHRTNSHVEGTANLHNAKSSAIQQRSPSSMGDLDRTNPTTTQDLEHRNEKADKLNEAYTDRLLLSEPMTEGMALDTKNYKSLEELKAILDERMKTWHSTTQAPAKSQVQTQGTHGRKRSLSSPLDSEVTGHPATKTRKCSHLRSCKGVSSDPQISDSHELCSRLKTSEISESIARASERQSDLSWSMTPVNRAPSQLPEIVIEPDPQKNTSYQPSTQQELEMDRPNATSHMDHLIALDCSDSNALFAQTLDAAYNVIVNGTHYFPESYVRSTVCTVGPSEPIAEATNHPYDDDFPKRSLFVTRGGVNPQGESQNDWSGLRWQTRDPWRRPFETEGSNTLDGVNAVNTDLEDGRLKGFWRRNKLY